MDDLGRINASDKHTVLLASKVNPDVYRLGKREKKD